MNPNNDEFFTIKEVSERLKISLSLAYRLVAAGEIPSHQFASCKRVHVEALRSYVDQQSCPQTKLPPGYRRHF